MFDIRVSPSLYNKFEKAIGKSKNVNNTSVFINSDKAVTKEVGALVMVHTEDGSLVEWGFRGEKQILGFIEKGFMPVRKFCPLLKKQCIGEKCAFHIVKNNIGDCSMIWNAIK